MNNSTKSSEAKKSVLVISSHVVRGSVGSRAAVFALETLGFPVWSLPTVTLPWHPGHGPATRLLPDEEQFSSVLDDLANAPWRDEIGAVLTGYMGSANQAKSVGKLIAALKQENDDLLYVCDPVLGDDGGLYVSEDIAQAIRDNLVSQADLVTPNRFELGFLCDGEPLETTSQCVKAARSLAVERVLVTSMPGFMKDHIGNCLVDKEQAFFCEHKEIEHPLNGLGDLTAAVFLANSLSGYDDEKALARTTSSVFEVLADTAHSGANELTLEQNAASLARPLAMVSSRNLGVNLANKKRVVLKPKSL